MSGAEDRKERYAYLKKIGRCVQCGKYPAADGTAICPNCRDVQSVYQMMRRAALLKSGLCVQCKAPLEDASRTLCRACAEKKAAIERSKRSMRKENGLCTTCGKIRVAGTGYSMCPVCREKWAQRNRLKKERIG